MSTFPQSALPTTRLSSASSRAAVAKARRGVRRRSMWVSLWLAAAGLLTFCLTLSIGDFTVPISKVVPAALGFGDDSLIFIVHDLRLPRAVVGLLVGGGLAISGAIFQSLARNPLASPDILGVTGGASLFAVLGMTVFNLSGGGVSIAAFLGALAAALVIYLLAFKGGGLSSYRLVLMGIGVAAICAALVNYFWTRAHLYDSLSATVWLSGSLNGIGWASVAPLCGGLLLLIPTALFLSRRLSMLQLGDDTAKGIGVGVERTRLLLLLVSVALAGVAVAAAGPVAFVAFVCPPIARGLARSPGPSMVPSALLGAVLVIGADLAGRQLFGALEVPVGILTGIIGAPYLLWVLAFSNRVGRGG